MLYFKRNLLIIDPAETIHSLLTNPIFFVLIIIDSINFKDEYPDIDKIEISELEFFI